MAGNISLFIFIAFSIFSSANSQDIDNCDILHWLPEGSVPPSNPECTPYDGSLIPDCGQYELNNQTSYYHIHEYNCSRFWECSPQGPCLFECAPCPADSGLCLGQEALSFDCRFQGEDGPVCDWPVNIECVYSSPKPTESTTPTTSTTTTSTTSTSTTTPDLGCQSDDDCEASEWCDTSGVIGVCKPGCRDDSGCTATSCSTCVDHVCQDPECCSDPDCPDVTDLVCSICSDQICSRPECCVDDDCEDGFVCEDQQCVPEGECDMERPCDGSNAVCNVPQYDNCNYCDDLVKECKPGCADNANCPQDDEIHYICSDHYCVSNGLPGIVNITIKTSSCNGCDEGPVEAGVMLYLVGRFGTECVTNSLDNLEKVDYGNDMTSFFDGAPDDDGDDDGMGGCKGFDTNLGLEGGSATWTGTGIWTASASSPVCINFFDQTGTKPTCCCDLAKQSLESGATSDLVKCSCA